jgi:hypothetical protein
VMFQVVMREEHLRDDEIVSGKKFLIRGHQARLPDGRTGLFFREVAGPAFKSERAHARAHRAAGDQDDFLAGPAQRGDLRHDLLQLRRVNLFPVVREDAGAELDHDAGEVFEKFRTHAGLVTKPERSVEARVGCLNGQTFETDDEVKRRHDFTVGASMHIWLGLAR